MTDPYVYKNACDRLLTALVGSKMTNQWWNSPNKAFDDETPKVVFETDPKRVYDYLAGHAYGSGGS